MKLEGKTINFLGDSITEGAGATSPDYFYWKQIADKTGAICNGYGISGTRIAKQKVKDDAAWDDGDKSFNTRVDAMDKNADIVIVFGGTNDYGHGDAAMGDINSEDEYTFYGAMNKLCENLIIKFPTSKIVFMTPMHRTDENNVFNERGLRNVAGLSGYVDAIKEVCYKYGLPVIDLFGELGINPNFGEMYKVYTVDGLHPNNLGHERVADFVIAKLQAL